jgi:hypothetical protein
MINIIKIFKKEIFSFLKKYMATLFVDTLIHITNDSPLTGELRLTDDALALTQPLAPLQVLIKQGATTKNLKLKLIDPQGCVVASLCVLAGDYLPQTLTTGDVLQLNILNVRVWTQYLDLEGKAFYLRKSTQNVHNLLCGAENNTEVLSGVVNVVNQLSGVIDYLSGLASDTELVDVLSGIQVEVGASLSGILDFAQNVAVDFLKMRVIALDELCECGKTCVDTCFVKPPSFCEARNGCQNVVRPTHLGYFRPSLNGCGVGPYNGLFGGAYGGYGPYGYGGLGLYGCANGNCL